MATPPPTAVQANPPPSVQPASSAGTTSRPPDIQPDDSGFEASVFERLPGGRRVNSSDSRRRWLGWYRRALVLVALLGCLGVFSLARWLAATPQLDASWASNTADQLVLQASPQRTLDAHRGHVLLAIGAPGFVPLQVDGLLLHRSPRWQVDDTVRQRQVAQHAQLAAMLASGRVQLQFDQGAPLDVAVVARGLIGLGVFFWPLAGLALLLVLSAAIVVLARPHPRNLLYVTMVLAQAINLLFIALESTRGLGLPAGAFTANMPVRVALDLCTGAAIVHAFALHPRRLPRANLAAALAWTAVPLWLLLTHQGWLTHLWWWAQGGCILHGCAALALMAQSHRLEPNPYAAVMRRFAVIGLGTLVLATTAVALAAWLPGASPGIAAGASVAWYLFLASLLLLTPFLARSRQVLREFAMLAGISTVATSLDLLFVAVFSLGPFTSLALAVFAALGLYAGARQWIVNLMLGQTMPTTERTFDQLYRAARELQQRPDRHRKLLARLLRDLFEPQDVLAVDRVPAQSRVIGGGAALVVPVRGIDDDAPSSALALRFARRGQRLFSVDDARLADRVADQLRRAVAYDKAVERGRFEERLRIAQDLHDDIGARLLTLMYQAQTPEMEEYIRHTLKDLKTLTRGLSAAEHRFSHAAAEWKADLTQRATWSHVNLNWVFTYDRDVRLSVVQWSALTRVLRELVTNALFHGQASRIDVQCTLEAGLLTLTVADDGAGRAPALWSHGLGLGGVRKRVKALGGSVEWRENGPRGIACTMRVEGFSGRA